MKTSAIWTILVIILLAINSVTLVILWKQKRPEPPMGNHMEVKDFIESKLNLTPPQVKQFDSLRQWHHRTVDSLSEVTRNLKDQLFSGLGNPAENAQFADSITKKIGYNSGLMDKITFEHFKAVRGILTAEQQVKFDGIIKQVLQMIANQGPPSNPGGPDTRPQGPPPTDGPPPPSGRPQGAPPEDPPGQ